MVTYLLLNALVAIRTKVNSSIKIGLSSSCSTQFLLFSKSFFFDLVPDKAQEMKENNWRKFYLFSGHLQVILVNLLPTSVHLAKKLKLLDNYNQKNSGLMRHKSIYHRNANSAHNRIIKERG